jgi:hypothetical protein
MTHDYYVIPLVLPTALSLIPSADRLLEPLAGIAQRWRAALVLLGILALLYPAWGVRSNLLGTDYRKEILGWVQMGEELPAEGAIIGFTHDYGYRLAYYGWRQVAVWPATYDREAAELQGHSSPESVEQEFAAYADGYRYFLITDFSEWNARADLRAFIEERYPVAREGDGYLLYDLAPSG